ncbi:MAG TPA: site-specific integrase [Terriglobales bacterium]
MSLYKRGNVWWSRIEVDGAVHQFSTQKSNKNEARGIESAKRTELGNGIGTAPTLEVFSERFKGSIQARVSKETFRFYTTHLRPLLAFEPLASCRLDRINAGLIDEFVQHRRKQDTANYHRRRPATSTRGITVTAPTPSKPVSVTTINHNLRTLRRMLQLAAEWNVINRAPKLKLLTGENIREYVLNDDTIAAFANGGGPMSRIVPFLCDTGLRRSEICNLTWDSVHLPLHSIEILKGKSKAARRRIPLTTLAERVLTKMDEIRRLTEQKSPYVFIVNEHQMTRDWLSHAFLRARKRLKLPESCVLHSTRHTFCTRLGERGADAFAIQKLAGHSSIVISQRYVHAQGPRLNTAIGLLEPRVASL